MWLKIQFPDFPQISNFPVWRRLTAQLTNQTGPDELQFERLESLLANTHQEDNEANRADSEADIENVGTSWTLFRLQLQ